MSPRTDAAWGELARLATGDGGARRLGERLLDLSAAAAALYLRSGDAFRCELKNSAWRHADRLAEPPFPATAIAFTGGFVAFEGESPEDEAVRLLLAAVGRELRLRDQLKRRDFEAKTRGVQLEALYDVGLVLASTLDLDRLCEEVALRAVSLVDARQSAVYLSEGSELRRRVAFGGEATERLRADDPIVASLLAGDASASAALLPEATYRLAVPIAVEGIPRGVLVVADKERREGVGPFSEIDERTLSLLANQAAIALANLELHRQALDRERLEREMELAADIQRRILPTAIPDVEGFELVGWNRSARHIGGDYFDFFRVEPNRLGLLVGDVSGKGVPAALLVSTLHSALRLLVDRLGVGPDLCLALNRHILESSGPNKFITLLLAELDLGTAALTFVNAGHNPGVVVRRDGTLARLGPGGLPLGLMPVTSYRSESIQLEPGDLVCLYSDGITEAVDASDVEYGLPRLEQLLIANRGGAVSAILAAIEADVTRHAESLPQGDDQTVLLLRRSL